MAKTSKGDGARAKLRAFLLDHIGEVLDSETLKDEAGGTLCRYPNAKDTESSAADWLLCSAPTPGAPNLP